MEWRPHNELLPGSETSGGIRVNTIIRRYPDGSALICAAERRIFRRPGFEATRSVAEWPELPTDPETAYALMERKAIEGDGGPTAAEQRRAEENKRRARRRAVGAVRDLAYANPFRYFVTLTFDKEKVDRWDDGEVLRVT